MTCTRADFLTRDSGNLPPVAEDSASEPVSHRCPHTASRTDRVFSSASANRWPQGENGDPGEQGSPGPDCPDCYSLQAPSYDPDALAAAVKITGGYPYFIQELGYAVWTVAAGPQISLDDITAAEPAYEAKLDSSFFRVRLDRATDLQRAYLRAMAQLGPAAQKASDVAEVMGRPSTNLGPTRAELINMGLLYTPQHGFAAFTVPHFGRYLRANA